METSARLLQRACELAIGAGELEEVAMEAPKFVTLGTPRAAEPSRAVDVCGGLSLARQGAADERQVL